MLSTKAGGRELGTQHTARKQRQDQACCSLSETQRLGDGDRHKQILGPLPEARSYRFTEPVERSQPEGSAGRGMCQISGSWAAIAATLQWKTSLLLSLCLCLSPACARTPCLPKNKVSCSLFSSFICCPCAGVAGVASAPWGACGWLWSHCELATRRCQGRARGLCLGDLEPDCAPVKVRGWAQGGRWEGLSSEGAFALGQLGRIWLLLPPPETVICRDAGF